MSSGTSSQRNKRSTVLWCSAPCSSITFVSKKRASEPRVRCLPNGVPLPAELRFFALSGDTSDSVCPSGSDYLSIPGSTIPYRGDHPVGGIPSPNRGCRHHNGTSPTSSLRNHLHSLMTHANRFIECIASTMGIFSCVPSPRQPLRLYLVSLFPLLCLCSPSIVAQSRFLSRRLWSDEPTSRSHDTGQPKSTGQVVFSLLLSHNIVSS